MLTYVIIGVMIFLAVYCLIDRICTAVENAAMCKAYSNFLSNGSAIDLAELKKCITKDKKGA